MGPQGGKTRHRFGDMYSRRQKLYRKVICRMQRYIVGLEKEEKRLKQEEELAKDPFAGAEHKKINVPKHLKYPIEKKMEEQVRG